MSVGIMVGISLGLIALDQITKFLASSFLVQQGSVPFIPYLLELRYTENHGAAFSMLSGYRWFLVALTAAALLVVAYLLGKHKLQSKAQEVCLIMVLSGGIGNLIDRIWHGYVVDFFHTVFMDFPIFNVADIFIVVGVILLIFLVLQQEIQEKSKKNPNSNEESL